MSAATEQKNNGDIAVEKVAADAVKDDLKKPVVEDSKPAADNGTASKDGDDVDASPAKEHVKGTKRPAEAKNAESKKAKKEKAADGDSDDEEVIEEYADSDSDEYDIPYDGEEDDIECEDEDDENDDGSCSDDEA